MSIVSQPITTEPPKRSMTHPLRDPKAKGRKTKHGDPFDPEELTRRLQAHLVDQKIKSDKRREVRAAKEAALLAQNGYHHVPSVAASSFERTTTQAKPSNSKMHKLSQAMLRTHLERVSMDDERPVHSLLQKTVALDQAALDAQALRNRNQFQWTQEMEEAREADEERDVYKKPQRTFNGEFEHIIGRKSRDVARPVSTGELWEEEGSPPPPTKHKAKPSHHDIVNDHRNDWAQRDDVVDMRKKGRKSPILRKMESSWMLMGKKEKGLKLQHSDEGIAGIGQSPPEKPIKVSFLARFKRQSSGGS